MSTIIYVTNLGGLQQEPLNNISDDFVMVQSTDGTFNISFTCFNGDDNPGYELVTSESTITVDGFDFIVKQISQSAFSKRITAISSFYEQSKKYVHGELNGIHTLQQRLDFVFNNSGWSYTVEGTITDTSAFMHDFGRSNRVALIRRICEFYGCEFEIRRDKSLHFTKQIGVESDEPFMYKHNVSSVVLREDTTNLYTKIVGYGANGLEVTHNSENRLIFGELEAPPVVDDRYTDSESLLEYLQRQIIDVPEIAIETSIPSVTKRGLGDRVWMLYDPLKIEMETRILQQTLVLRDGELVTASVILGNAQPKSTTDLILEQREAHNTLSNEAVKQEQLYNGVEITRENGVVVSANNNVVVMLNATEGISITNGAIRKFYVDTTGNVTFDGRLNITNGDGATTLLEAFRDTNGGILTLHDNVGNQLAKLGATNDGGGVYGGNVSLYDNSGLKGVDVGMFVGGGYITLANGNPNQTARLRSDAVLGPALEIGSNTYLESNAGYISGQQIATQQWIQSQGYATQGFVFGLGYVTANVVQQMIDAALPK